MPVVHVIGDDTDVSEMFEDAGYKLFLGGVPDLVCFTGGGDISPVLHHQENTHSSGINKDRDLYEIAMFMRYASLDVPMVGICRGAQLLNVLLGGSLHQDITGHKMGHQKVHLLEFNGKINGHAVVHEDHHQGMIPAKSGKVIAKAHDGVAEVIYFPDINILCFQPHPEWGHKPTRDMFLSAVVRLMDNAK